MCPGTKSGRDDECAIMSSSASASPEPDSSTRRNRKAMDVLTTNNIAYRDFAVGGVGSNKPEEPVACGMLQDVMKMVTEKRHTPQAEVDTADISDHGDLNSIKKSKLNTRVASYEGHEENSP